LTGSGQAVVAIAASLMGLLTACGDSGSVTQAPPPTTTTTQAPAPTTVTTQAPPPTTTNTTLEAEPSHCSSATPDTLHAAAQMDIGSRVHQPFTIDEIQCADDWIRARIPGVPAYPQGAMVLFHYTEGRWTVAGFGSGFSCAEEGAPAAVAEQFGCP
jgi:hypothetical protein